MKLIFAVVNGDDSAAVSKALSKHGFRATKLASSGSFLSSGNTTFLICVEEDQIDAVIDVIQQKCHHQDLQVFQTMQPLLSPSLHRRYGG